MKFITLHDEEAQLVVDGLHLLASTLEDRIDLNDLDSSQLEELRDRVSRCNDLAVGLL